MQRKQYTTKKAGIQHGETTEENTQTFETASDTQGGREPSQEKGKDTFLLIMLALTIFIAIIGWQEMTWLNRSMYGSLALSLLLIYGYKQGNFGEKEKLWMTRASMFFIVVSFALFVAICYFQYFA